MAMQDQVELAQRAGFWVWMLGGGLAALTVCCGMSESEYGVGLYLLGAIFAVSLMAYARLAGRLDWGAVIVATLGAGFGAWFPIWAESVAPISRHWLLELGLSSTLTVDRFAIPSAIASAGALTGAALYIPTRSGRIVLQTGLLSLVVATVPLLPVHEEGAIMGAVIAWHVAVSGSLYRWMVERVRSGAGLLCASCGFDLVGLSSPVCPGCGSSLSRAAAVSGASRARVARAPAAPIARWY